MLWLSLSLSFSRLHGDYRKKYSRFSWLRLRGCCRVYLDLIPECFSSVFSISFSFLYFFFLFFFCLLFSFSFYFYLTFSFSSSSVVLCYHHLFFFLLFFLRPHHRRLLIFINFFFSFSTSSFFTSSPSSTCFTLVYDLPLKKVDSTVIQLCTIYWTVSFKPLNQKVTCYRWFPLLLIISH